MRKRSLLAVLLAFMAFTLLAVSAFADQNGNDSWCNTDEYGCWVTDEDGGKCYIMFWSEEARAYFMGGKSKPGELVTVMPAEASSGRMGMEIPSRTSSRTWRDVLADMLKKHRKYLEGQGNDISDLLEKNIEGFEKNIADGVMNESQIIDLINYWDESYTYDEKSK